ncbi:acetolactate synthase small subunit [Planctomycetales bacterium]|nr:acetolactate synthase small subunit [Planctomycetales bacterium]GHV22519.1 acetolactate synthase small subunit [Planctomycetales bacterium]
MKHTISVLVSNEPGVLARVAGLFSARGFNIASLAVGETENPSLSRMTIVVTGDDAILEQVRKQLSKLIDTIKVQDLSDAAITARDVLLVKVNAAPEKRAEILAVAQAFVARILHLAEKRMILELTGDEDQIARFLTVLRPYGIVEVSRAGRIAMALD